MVDGSIRIKAELLKSDMDADLKELSKSMERTAKNMQKAFDQLDINPAKALSSADRQIADFEAQIRSAEETIVELTEKLNEVSGEKIETDDYIKLKNDVEKAEQAVFRLYNRQEKMSETGVSDKYLLRL